MNIKKTKSYKYNLKELKLPPVDKTELKTVISLICNTLILHGCVVDKSATCYFKTYISM